MVFCGAAIVIPIILCFLSMIMLFMAEGKKTMFLPTVFTFATSAEMVLVLLLFSQLRPFLMVGVYLFTLLNVFALIFILAGWLTGGYSQPYRRLGRYGNDNDKSSDDDNDGSRRKRTKRKTRRKKKTKKKKKKDKNSDRNDDKKDDKKDEQKNKNSNAVVGKISDGNGIYHGLTWNLTDGNEQTVTIGTTADAMDALASNSLKNMNAIAENNCTVTFDAAAKKYKIESHSKADILILQDGKVVKWLKNGDSHVVASKAVLQIDGRRDSVRLG